MGVSALTVKTNEFIRTIELKGYKTNRNGDYLTVSDMGNEILTLNTNTWSYCAETHFDENKYPKLLARIAFYGSLPKVGDTRCS